MRNFAASDQVKSSYRSGQRAPQRVYRSLQEPTAATLSHALPTGGAARWETQRGGGGLAGHVGVWLSMCAVH